MNEFEYEETLKEHRQEALEEGQPDSRSGLFAQDPLNAKQRQGPKWNPCLYLQFIWLCQLAYVNTLSDKIQSDLSTASDLFQRHSTLPQDLLHNNHEQENDAYL